MNSQTEPESHASILKRYVEGLVLMIIGSGLGTYYLIGVQQLIWIYNPKLEGEAVEAKSIMFIIFASIVLGPLFGRVSQSLKEGYYRITGLIIGLSMGYIGFLITSILITGMDIYYVGLISMCGLTIASYFIGKGHKDNPVLPRANMVF